MFILKKGHISFQNIFGSRSYVDIKLRNLISYVDIRRSDIIVKTQISQMRGNLYQILNVENCKTSYLYFSAKSLITKSVTRNFMINSKMENENKSFTNTSEIFFMRS